MLKKYHAIEFIGVFSMNDGNLGKLQKKVLFFFQEKSRVFWNTDLLVTVE